MPNRLPAEDYDVKIKFGGGLHTRAPEDEVQEREATAGVNFILDAENSDLRPRGPFDLLGTAPNAGSIRGGGSYRKADGSVVMFIQAGNTVYEWDGASFQASPTLDTVNANAQLRGHWRSHAWELGDKVLVSDLALLEPVKEWDGTTFTDVSFRSSPSTAFANDFYCKYINVTDERVIYSGIRDGSSTLKHMMVGSERSDYEEISVSDRPSSALGESDPFFILSPDLREINGFVEAFGTRVISTERGRIFELTGDSSKDFAIREFYPGSFAAGDESLAYIGTDIIYGRPGRIESLRDTDTYGDTAADDLSRVILDQVKNNNNWTTVYNSRLNRVYIFPDGASEVWVYDTAMRDSGLSPWMRWRTAHPLAFMPTMVMSMLDPLDGLEYVFMGDSSGNLYRLEGTGENGDGGTTAISTQWCSKLFSLPLDVKAFNVQGYIKYRRGQYDQEVSIDMLFAGENLLDQNRVADIPRAQADAHYENDAHYSGQAYYGTAFLSRLIRQKFEMPGGDANEFQICLTVESNNDFDINEVGLRFRGAN